MEAADREKMLRLLAESRDAFLDSARGVSEEQARKKPAPDRWSVIECAEHVALAEDGMFTILSTKSRPAVDSGDRSREELLLRGATDRSNKIESPEQVLPTGRFGSLAEALDHFRASRARTIAYIENHPDNLRACTVKHARFGLQTGQEQLIILALHPARHAAQIREVRQNLGIA